MCFVFSMISSCRYFVCALLVYLWCRNRERQRAVYDIPPKLNSHCTVTIIFQVRSKSRQTKDGYTYAVENQYTIQCLLHKYNAYNEMWSFKAFPHCDKKSNVRVSCAELDFKNEFAGGFIYFLCQKRNKFYFDCIAY